MKICSPEKSHISRGQRPGKYDYFEGEQIFISPLCKGRECCIPPRLRFDEFCQMKYFGRLCFVPTTYYLVPSIYYFVPTTYDIIPFQNIYSTYIEIRLVSRVSKSSYLPYAREMNIVFPQAYVLVNSAK
jgi:hypothetical protein